MPHETANTLCKKLRQLGEWVELFCLAAPAGGRSAKQKSVGIIHNSRRDPKSLTAGITFKEFRKIGVLKGNKLYRAYLSKGFSTPSGKVEIYSQRLKEWGFNPLPFYYEHPETSGTSPDLGDEYPLVFTSGKCGCYRHSDNRQIYSLRGSHPEPVTFINPETAKKSGIADGDQIYIVTRRGRIRQRAALSSDIDPRVIVVDYGWWFPEDGPTDLYGWKESNINILTDDKPPYNREMGSSNLRGVPCKVYKA